MSIKAIYDTIKALLPNTPIKWQENFFLGARYLANHAGTHRIVMVPDEDRYVPRARQGRTNPQELYSYDGAILFYIEAPNYETIDAPTGIRNALISLLERGGFKGSYRPEQGRWNMTDAAGLSVRGELYILRIVFGQPVVEAEFKEVAIVASDPATDQASVDQSVEINS